MRVHVVSWVYWNGPEQGGGGFDWMPAQNVSDRLMAIDGFYEEWKRWLGGVARVRLLLDVDVPAGLSREQITDHLDSRIDLLELAPSKGGLRAAKVALMGVDR
jgi:hypothetical protein